MEARFGAGLVRALGIALVGVLVIGALVFLWPSQDVRTMKASFPRTVSIYEGSDVRVLGVGVGRVVEVRPAGTTVEVTMEYDGELKVPADVKAVVVAPSVVGDRFVQLTPAYRSGPVLEDGAKLSADQTAIPLELDEIYQALSDLAEGLGPEGANQDGALSRLLESTADNFGGQGAQFNETIRNLSRFTSTLDNNKDALFDTAEEIDQFVQVLADNDQTVRDFNDSLAAASAVLEDEREDLAASLRHLGVAMEEVSGFVKENREALSGNIKSLTRVTRVLVKNRDALDETLSAAPTALSNLFHTYNPSTGTLDTRANMGEIIDSAERDPASTLCSLVTTIDPNGDLCDTFVDVLGRSAPGKEATGPKAKSASRPDSGRVVVIERIDTTLAGIVEVDR